MILEVISRHSNWGHLVGVILSREPANFLGCGIQRSHGVRGRRISLNNERFDYFGEGTLLACLHHVTQPDAVTINKKPDSDFRNPIGMLCDCHRRIERFLAGLIAIARGARGGSIPEANRALFESGLRYFREAAPKHTLDEEESLFPRLLKYPDPQTKDALAVLDHLEAEHIKAADRHIVVDRLGREWLAQGSLSSVEADFAHCQPSETTLRL
jgi:hypothetical protein